MNENGLQKLSFLLTSGSGSGDADYAITKLGAGDCKIKYQNILHTDFAYINHKSLLDKTSHTPSGETGGQNWQFLYVGLKILHAPSPDDNLCPAKKTKNEVLTYLRRKY